MPGGCGRLRRMAAYALARPGPVSPVGPGIGPGAGSTLWGLPAAVKAGLRCLGSDVTYPHGQTSGQVTHK